jgi:hypothetical protein
MSTPEHLMVFIDGQNLLYGCMDFARERKPDYEFRYREEDLLTLLTGLRPNRRLTQTRFYTSYSCGIYSVSRNNARNWMS